MKLLILTQKVDRNDDILGFFHEWIKAFAKKYERVTVVCLEKGEYDLPANVSVHSLGKERNSFFKRPKYVWRFYSLIVRERENYDAVFIHMNPEYAVLGGILWRLWGKRVALWYNHKQGGVLARLGVLLAHRVFYTSGRAFMTRHKKAKQMPAGIDTSERTVQNAKRKVAVQSAKPSILSLGRISPVKQIGVIIDALRELDERGIDFEASIYGNPTDRDTLYYHDIRKRARSLEKKGFVHFHPAVPHRETPAIFASHSVFVNATPSGSLDKTILEAAYYGALPVVCNDSFRGFLPDKFFFTEDDSADLADTLAYARSLPAAERSALGGDLRRRVEAEHGLSKLLDSLHKELDMV